MAVTTGNRNTCAILDDGSVKCWGEDSQGQLGNGATSGNQPSPVSVDVGTGRTAVAIDVFGYHACAVLDDASMKCWGSDGAQQLGNGLGFIAQNTPGLVTGSHTWDVTSTTSSASADTAGDATVSACLDGWSSCTTASDWTVDASLFGINSTTMAMAVDLDQNHYLAYNSSNGLMLTGVGAAGTVPPTTPCGRMALRKLTCIGRLPASCMRRFATPATATSGWSAPTVSVRVGMNVDLDGDGWLGIDEQACGTDAHDVVHAFRRGR